MGILGLFSKPQSRVSVVRPTGRVLYQFECLDNFFCEDVQTQYVKTGIYSVREGNENLDGLVSEWIGEGKARKL